MTHFSDCSTFGGIIVYVKNQEIGERLPTSCWLTVNEHFTEQIQYFSKNIVVTTSIRFDVQISSNLLPKYDRQQTKQQTQ
jgi:hypothetical protein